MALPSKPGTSREFAELRREEIFDPNFEKPAVVYFRPLLSTEMDLSDAEAVKFQKMYFDGGFIHPVTEAWTDKPMPLVVDGQPVPLGRDQVVKLHRYAAMQIPMRGKAPADQDLITVGDMVQAMVMHDVFWRSFEAFAQEVWNEGETGKAWGRPLASTPPESESQNEAA